MVKMLKQRHKKMNRHPKKMLPYFFTATRTLVLCVSPVYASNQITEFDGVTTTTTTQQTTTTTGSTTSPVQQIPQQPDTSASNNPTLYHYTCGELPGKNSKSTHDERWSRDKQWGLGERVRYQLAFDGFVDSNNQFSIPNEDQTKWPKLSVQGIQDIDANKITNPRTNQKELDWDNKATNWNLKHDDGSYEPNYILSPSDSNTHQWVYGSKFTVIIPIEGPKNTHKAHHKDVDLKPNPASYVFVRITHNCSDERCVDPNLTGKAKANAMQHQPHVEFIEKCFAQKKDSQ